MAGYIVNGLVYSPHDASHLLWRAAEDLPTGSSPQGYKAWLDNV